MVKTRLTKSSTDRVIDGVCGGIAEYFSVDPVMIRLIFIALVFMNGLGVLLYIILAIIMPKAEKVDQLTKDTIQENVHEMGERLKETGEKLGSTLSRESKEGIDMDVFWPLVLIFIGVWLLISRLRG